MADDVDWVPSAEDLAYWKFLRKTGMELRAHLCLKDRRARMWVRPREPWIRAAFIEAHAGHEHLAVSHVLDRYLAARS